MPYIDDDNSGGYALGPPMRRKPFRKPQYGLAGPMPVVQQNPVSPANAAGGSPADASPSLGLALGSLSASLAARPGPRTAGAMPGAVARRRRMPL